MKERSGNKSYLDTKIGFFNKEAGYTTIYVGNLSYKKTEDQIKSLFAQHGVVKYVKVIKDPETQRSKGIAFLQMINQKKAHLAIAKLNGSQVDGRTLKVSVAQERDPADGPSSGKVRRKPYKAYTAKKRD